MMYLTKILSSTLTKSRRIAKFLRLGKDDVQTATEVGPYGIDSSPIKDMVAVYAETSKKGDTVIIGYINKNQLAQPGEFRIYSTDENGQQKFYAWLKNDGTIELGGALHNLLRFTPLNSALQGEVTAINAELAKIAIAINAIVPGSYTPTPITLDITASKINEIKTL
jgi:hypothetical protein